VKSVGGVVSRRLGKDLILRVRDKNLYVKLILNGKCGKTIYFGAFFTQDYGRGNEEIMKVINRP